MDRTRVRGPSQALLAGWVFAHVAASPTAAQRVLSDETHVLVPGGELSVMWTAGDVDGDGDSDLVRHQRVLTNDGNGVFRRSPCSPLAEPFESVGVPALGDLDGDGDLDLVVGLYGPERLWLNDGAGCWSEASFQLPPPVGTGHTIAIALGDVDGDGDLDLVLANRGEATVQPGDLRLWLNDGAAGFSDASTRIPAVADEDPCSVALGDVDTDGDLDLVALGARDAGYSARHRVLLNDGAGNFADTSAMIPLDSVWTLTSAQLVDLDSDQDLDLVIGDGTLWHNVGGGGFVDATSTLPPPLPVWIEWAAAGDLDGDGDADLCLASTVGDDRVLTNDGSGGFTDGAGLSASPDRSARVDWLDVDGDADLDLVRQKFGHTQVLFGNGAGAFARVPRLVPTAPEHTHALATGDVDGDGYEDVLAGVWGQSRLLLNRGNGEFVDATAQLPVEGERTCGVALADVDGDGDLDLLLANGGDGSGQAEALYLNDGTGSFSSAPPSWWSTPQDRSYTMAVADVDADGDSDVFVGNASAPDRLYFNDGTGRFAEQPGAFPASVFHTYAARFADVEPDGDPDLFTTSGAVRLFLNDGSGTFSQASTQFGPVNTLTWGLDLGDVDGDGDLDLVHTSYTPQRIVLYRNDGGYVFTNVSGQITGVPATPFVCRLVDLDLDGDLDLLTAPPLALLSNDGSGTFALTAGSVPPVPDSPYALLFADLDLDRDLDALLGYAAAPVQVLPNLTCHLAWRTPPRIGRTLELDLAGPPGASWMILGSLGRAFVPIGGAGVLQVARGQRFTSAHGVFDAQGHALYAWPVPANAALVGTSAYWQLVQRPPRRLSKLEITTWIDL